MENQACEITNIMNYPVDSPSVKKGVSKEKRRRIQNIGIIVLFLSLLISAVFLFIIVIFISIQGARILNWEFLTSMPRRSMTAGGILPAILGTFYLALGAILFALPLGVLSGIYLNEYARDNFIVRILKTGINNLAGVPSIVFGLFGLAVFVKFFGFGVSILSGSLTLGIMILPVIISTTVEALRSVPDSFREAAYGVGATKWQTIRGIVLPAALPGILTGVVLAIGRAAGETAPILFTAATFFSKKLPSSIMSPVQALPYHIYALMTEGTYPEKQVPIAYGSALVLLMLVLGMNLIAIIIRIRQRKKRQW
ncbi:MAG: phosphate ABC transporter permease PstA [candidate division WOR-3 bacterium]|nr:phosphate ABC transporter permease PstA [candidate division WOR-3 bacterium]